MSSGLDLLWSKPYSWDADGVGLVKDWVVSFRYPIQVSPVVSYQWGFTDGGGLPDDIYNDLGDLKFTSQMLHDNLESPVAFWTLMGSYFSDFNYGINNFPRSMLAQANYSLVVLPLSASGGEPEWTLERMALGEHIGSGWLASVNNAAPDKRWRWLCLLGDPTLRLNRLKPPANADAVLNQAFVTVSWDAVPGASRYYVYRAASVNGPFEQVGDWVVQSPKTNIAHDAARTLYMVRAAALTSTGRGSYWNLSQGAFEAVH